MLAMACAGVPHDDRGRCISNAAVVDNCKPDAVRAGLGVRVRHAEVGGAAGGKRGRGRGAIAEGLLHGVGIPRARVSEMAGERHRLLRQEHRRG